MPDHISAVVDPAERRAKGRRLMIDRRGDLNDLGVAYTGEERRSGERRSKTERRRQIDPTTCERDYSDDEIEFMHALDAYKRFSGRMFPTCSEILEVIRALGYVRVKEQMSSSAAPEAAVDSPTTSA